jgi:hypothetical protein
VQNRRTFNLISAPWIPVIRESGRRDRIQPARLTDEIDTDPIRDLDFPRADFRCAALEFLIGLLTVACPPCDDWKGRWTSPPSRATLEAAFAPFAAALTFDGEGPRAFQDLEEFSTKPTPVEALLIEAPGAETKKKNAALLVKAGLVEVLSRPAASIRRLCLTSAPRSQHRTSQIQRRGLRRRRERVQTEDPRHRRRLWTPRAPQPEHEVATEARGWRSTFRRSIARLVPQPGQNRQKKVAFEAIAVDYGTRNRCKVASAMLYRISIQGGKK